MFLFNGALCATSYPGLLSSFLPSPRNEASVMVHLLRLALFKLMIYSVQCSQIEYVSCGMSCVLKVIAKWSCKIFHLFNKECIFENNWHYICRGTNTPYERIHWSFALLERLRRKYFTETEKVHLFRMHSCYWHFFGGNSLVN